MDNLDRHFRIQSVFSSRGYDRAENNCGGNSAIRRK